MFVPVAVKLTTSLLQIIVAEDDIDTLGVTVVGTVSIAALEVNVALPI